MVGRCEKIYSPELKIELAICDDPTLLRFLLSSINTQLLSAKGLFNGPVYSRIPKNYFSPRRATAIHRKTVAPLGDPYQFLGGIT
jgi:hypothetical protein